MSAVDFTGEVLSAALSRVDLTTVRATGLAGLVGENSDFFRRGMTCFYKDGASHREGDEPSIVCDEYIIWCKNGKKHRDNGLPAVIYADGREEHWVDGVLQRKNY